MDTATQQHLAWVARSFGRRRYLPFTTDDLALLAQLAEERGAKLITTEKDAARLPPAFRTRCLVLPVRLVLDDWTAIDAGLAGLGL